MTLHQDLTKGAVDGVAVTATPRGLSTVQTPGCAAAIWERAPLESFQSWIDARALEELPRGRLILQPHAVRAAMHDMADLHGMPSCDERTMFVDDVAALSQIFATLMDAPYLRLRLGVVTGNACRKFHLDSLTARLICTYRGTGTQYALAQEDGEPTEVFTAPTGSPIIMRGTLWPTGLPRDVLHRSPPIEGSGEARLVLVLDPIQDLEAAQREEALH
ncbi:MAG: DUF1826 domain-containing protein [Pseudomonadota bacterium]